MMTRHSIRFVALFTGFLLSGLVLTNLILIAMGLVPLCVWLVGLFADTPRRLSVRGGDVKTPVWVGDVVTIEWEITIGEGMGMVSLFQELPTHFALAGGSNLKVCWKGWGPKTVSFAYSVRCAKRGRYTLPPVEWEARHPLGLTETKQGCLGQPYEMIVRPRIVSIRRMRGMAGIATSPFPVVDIAKIGVTTTDFREIRSYVHGDPIKTINWTATARRAAQGQPWPLVNEYEVEGKKSVWLYLDAASYLEVGTEIENVFEYCLEAANGIACYYIEGGYRLGMYIYNDGDRLLYPDAGRKQFLRVSRELIKLKTTHRSDEFPGAIEKCRRYLLGYNPLCIVITRLDSEAGYTVIEGIKKLRRLRGRKRRRLPVIVVNIAGYHLMPTLGQYDENASTMLRLRNKPLVLQLRRLGTSVLEWNPRQESFSTALLREARAR